MGAGLYYLLYNNKTAPLAEETVYKDLIKVASPRANDLVTNPLFIKGEARGNWYFEASFPVKLFDANGEIVEAGGTKDYQTKKATVSVSWDQNGNTHSV